MTEHEDLAKAEALLMRWASTLYIKDDFKGKKDIISKLAWDTGTFIGEMSKKRAEAER